MNEPSVNITALTYLLIGISGAVGAVAGAVIAFAGAVWKTNQEIRHQESESRLDRRVAARREWLSAFQLNLGRSLEAAERQRIELTAYLVYEWRDQQDQQQGKPKGSVLSTQEAIETKTNLDSTIQQFRVHAQRLKEAREQNPDAELDKLADRFTSQSEELEKKLFEALAKIVDAQYGSKEEAEQSAQREYLELTASLRNLSMQINRRVEQLLEGAEYTE